MLQFGSHFSCLPEKVGRATLGVAGELITTPCGGVEGTVTSKSAVRCSLMSLLSSAIASMYAVSARL